ncbi:hypothetical protein [Mycobacteroides abscessus]|uniref:hypothetical protein n=1 Tax=Mycobacteroides abscessus TaxID=36809 RepID=UPI0009A84407|nr:hypothetical protein [Mycobacteroides abscessus]SKI82466.1 Uncharacterised protein [Mycobacteroides abscessus subsp. massiliense]
MSDEPSDAQKLIAEVIATHRALFDGEACDACDWKFTNEYYGHDQHVAVEVDKALGGLNRTWAAVFPDGSYMTPYHEVWNFHTNKSARELAEGDVAEYEDTTLKAQWVSGWTVTE